MRGTCDSAPVTQETEMARHILIKNHQNRDVVINLEAVQIISQYSSLTDAVRPEWKLVFYNNGSILVSFDTAQLVALELGVTLPFTAHREPA